MIKNLERKIDHRGGMRHGKTDDEYKKIFDEFDGNENHIFAAKLASQKYGYTYAAFQIRWKRMNLI
ncbi:hypothetical protein HYT25_00490 [Candidatus Pacearchaeota archaeon]|nr:hypothetical protein [Candidatus Pacearchaeota archaeon]